MHVLRLTSLLLFVCVLASFTTGWARAEDADNESGAEADGGDGDEVDEDDVVVLTKDNFDKVVKDTEYVLAEFYAPWCGYCKQLAPEFVAAATALSQVENVVLAKIDATEQTELAETHGVEGYPTLKWFVNGTANEYGGGRDEDGIVRWIKRQLGPVGITVDTAEALTEHEKQGHVLLIGYFAALDDSNTAYKKFKEAAVDVDMPVLQTTSADVAKAAGGLSVDSLVLIKNPEGGSREVVKYTKSISGEALRKFAAIQALPLVTPFNNANSEAIFGADIPRHLLLIGRAGDVKAESALYKEFAKVAADMRDQQAFVFVSVDADDEEGEPVMEFFNLAKKDLPALWGFQFDPDQKKYRFDGDKMSAAAMQKFAQGVVDGAVEAEYMTAEIPADDVDNDVKVVVGKSFETIVLDPKKDVLLEVYAPWCGHCKTLAPIYEQLAARFKGVDSVVIAKMDGTENEHPSLDVEGYPSIMFYPAGNKVSAPVIEYEDDRSLEALIKFIENNAKTDFDLDTSATAAPGTDSVDGGAGANAKDEL